MENERMFVKWRELCIQTEEGLDASIGGGGEVVYRKVFDSLLTS